MKAIVTELLKIDRSIQFNDILGVRQLIGVLRTRALLTSPTSISESDSEFHLVVLNPDLMVRSPPRLVSPDLAQCFPVRRNFDAIESGLTDPGSAALLGEVGATVS